jgi:hypothetical protein
MLLSRFSVRDDSLVFPPQGDVLQLFENSGPATGWILDIPPDRNDIDYGAIADVKLVLSYDAFYSSVVAAAAASELAAEPHTYSLGLSLATEFPEEFFELQHATALDFEITETQLPYDQTAPTITNLTLILQVEPGAPKEGISVTVLRDAGPSVSDTTDANGQIAADPAGTAPLNDFIGVSLTGTWHVQLNGPQPDGFEAKDVSNVFLWVEYDYVPRTTM